MSTAVSTKNKMSHANSKYMYLFRDRYQISSMLFTVTIKPKSSPRLPPFMDDNRKNYLLTVKDRK